MAAETFERHDLVSVRPGGEDPLPRTVPAAARRAWEAAGRPLILRRGAAGRDLPLGLPLPPSMGKARIALALPPHRVAARRSPDLADLSGQAPDGWRETMGRAAALARRHGLRVTPYGALLWQGLLGLRYLHAGSDLDLLWRCPAQVPAGFLDELSRLAENAPVRLDGEVVVRGGGVQWRELAGAGPDDPVLCRSRAGVEMRSARWFRAPCPA